MPIALVYGKPFLSYVREMDHALGALLAQPNDKGHEHTIYYLSQTMIGAEYRYNHMEQECRLWFLLSKNVKLPDRANN